MEAVLSPEVLALLFATGVAAGFVDSMAGGGGLIALPALLAAGLGPVEALATNKLQGSFGTLSASVHFARHGHVAPREMGLLVGCTFAGATAGTFLVQRLNPEFLARFIPVLLIAFALYFLFSPRAGDVDAHRRVSEPVFAFTAGAGCGFYDGFFGPGAGSFLALAFVALAGYNLRKATAHTKVLNLASNLGSLWLFAAAGFVAWVPGLVMGAGQFAGARLGSALVIRRGAGLVRPLLVVVSLAISLKLLLAPPAPAPAPAPDAREASPAGIRP